MNSTSDQYWHRRRLPPGPGRLLDRAATRVTPGSRDTPARCSCNSPSGSQPGSRAIKGPRHRPAGLRQVARDAAVAGVGHSGQIA